MPSSRRVRAEWVCGSSDGRGASDEPRVGEQVMARDYQQELIGIEVQRQANNERIRTEGRQERQRYEEVQNDLPQDDPRRAAYGELIEESKLREKDLVNSNDRTAGARAAQVESEQVAEQEAARAGIKVVDPPAAVNDNSADPKSILAVPRNEAEAMPAPVPMAETEAGGGILSSMSGWAQSAQNVVSAVGLVNMMDATVIHPMGLGNPSMGELMNQPPAVERQITQAEARGGAEQLVESPPIGNESASVARPAPMPDLREALQKFDDTVHDKMDKRVPQEETPRARTQSYGESGAKSAEALEFANQNARSRSADDIVPPPPPPPPPQVPANDNTLQH
jgi:hypothetical protein